MKTTLLMRSVVVSAALTVSGLMFMAPASTAATIAINCTTSAPMVQVPAGDTVEVTGCTEVKWSPVPSTVTTISVKAGSQTISSGGTSTSYSGPLTVSGINNGESASLELYVTAGSQPLYQITLSGGPGGNSNTSSSATVSQPVPATLALDLAASGASCTEGSAVSGVAGAWMKLPAADACTSTTRPGAKLLGWSTSASFPVALAQSQVNKGWGAIDDTFNGVRMIFIPAGQSTFVSGSNSLHPIWAS